MSTPQTNPPKPTQAPVLALKKPSYKTLDELSHPITALLKGASGTGKTWTACHFPRAVLVSFDNNTDGLRALPPAAKANLLGVIHANLHPTTGAKLPEEAVWDNTMNLLDDLVRDPNVGTIVFDSLTTMAAALEDKLLKTGKPEVNMQIQTWGEYQRFLKAFFQLICNDASIKKHIVVIAHENTVTEKVGDGPNAKEVFKGYELLLPTKIRNQIELYFSNVIRFSIENGQLGSSYVLQPTPSQTWTAKTTLDCLRGKKSIAFDKVKDELVRELEARLK